MSDRARRLLPRSKKVRAILVAFVLLVLATAAGGYIYVRHRTGSIYHPNARFINEATPTLATGRDRFSWPFYGYSTDHTRYFPAPATLHAPFKTLWAHNMNTLLEFPPVIGGDHLFQLGDDGILRAISTETGALFWSKRLGVLSASTPAVVGGTVYATVLERGHPVKPGLIAALNYSNGAVLWARQLPSPSESSPLVVDGRVFFGTQSGLVYALNASTGAVIWTYKAAGSVKASPTLKNGVLYFGDYSGHVQAVSEQTGQRIWVSSSEGAIFGSGTFYSTAAVVYGRVFLGNTDGRVYAYDAGTGALDWAVQTGDYVYASPAVTDAPGLGPTVYVGSYDGTFYALNARTGKIDWRFDPGGRISGSATVIGRTVYFADLGEHRTYGLGISTGHVSFEMDSGAFDPAISDGRDIYLTGYTGLYALAPQSDPPR